MYIYTCICVYVCKEREEVWIKVTFRLLHQKIAAKKKKSWLFLSSLDAAVLKQHFASFLPTFLSSRHPSFLPSFLPSTLAYPLFSLSVGPRADSTQTQLPCLGLGELCVWPLLGPIMVAEFFFQIRSPDKQCRLIAKSDYGGQRGQYLASA